MDRIDLHVDVPAVKMSDLQTETASESSAAIAARVQKARDIQRLRYESLGLDGKEPINANADGRILEDATPMDADAKALLTRAAEQTKISARGYFRILRVARTIADLNGGAENLCKADIAEALSYRRINLNS